jgi:hypothetical protein
VCHHFQRIKTSFAYEIIAANGDKFSRKNYYNSAKTGAENEAKL